MYAMSHRSIVMVNEFLYKPIYAVGILLLSYLIGVACSYLAALIFNINDPQLFLTFRLCFLLTLVLFISRKYALLGIKEYGFCRPSLNNILVVIGVSIALFILDVCIHIIGISGDLSTRSWVNIISNYLSTWEFSDSLYIYFLSAVVVASISEELAFRGILQPSLSSTFLKNYGAIVLTSLVWSLDHPQVWVSEELQGFNFIIFLGVVFTGFILGLIRYKYNNLQLCILLHFLINLFWFLIWSVVIQ